MRSRYLRVGKRSGVCGNDDQMVADMGGSDDQICVERELSDQVYVEVDAKDQSSDKRDEVDRSSYRVDMFKYSPLCSCLIVSTHVFSRMLYQLVS